MASNCLLVITLTSLKLIMCSIPTIPYGHYNDHRDPTEHRCYRECIGSVPMECEYNFVIELYQTMSKACYNCPHNITDCDRPHCIAADGQPRGLKVVNRLMPGPAIHVCEGDTVKVFVHNQMIDVEGVVIHWHGILHPQFPYMDGTNMITQCPINGYSSFLYHFTATNAGTHYWHAHSGLQRADGIFGALIIRPTVSNPDIHDLYDYDLPEHTLIVHDWLSELASARFADHTHDFGDDIPTSILINGKGAYQTYNSTVPSNEIPSGNSPTLQDIFTPFSVFRVTHGKKYRFRFISNGILNCPIEISVDNHMLIAIATDGNNFLPEEAHTFVIFAGERYDVIIVANQTVGNYWIRAIGLADCEESGATQKAILRYESATEELPISMPWDTDQQKSINALDNPSHSSSSADLTALTPNPAGLDRAPDTKYYINMDFDRVMNPRFIDPTLYPLSIFKDDLSEDELKHSFALQLNHITFKFPSSPLLIQYDDSKEQFCDESTLHHKNCSTEFCECIHRLKVGLNDLVELVIVSEGKYGNGSHPMHLHGHRFWVLASEKVAVSVLRSGIEAMDARGELPRNYTHAVQKDTVYVPDGGYVILRFVADTPGIWLFHCHVDFHFAQGMSLVIQVGEPDQFRKLPKNFPRCGNWLEIKFDDDNARRNLTCGCFRIVVDTIFMFMCVLSVTFLY